ncbi:MAG TPA: hypothetical protein VL854_06640 [Nitrososphaeraceae archaeon]|nr:hypothetical protein [Nitrososphaeraceae archaeon]
MTLYKDVVRVKSPYENLRGYFPKRGIEMVIKPYQPENDLYDVMFRTSDMNPCLSERLLMKDIDKEVERLRFIYSDRTRDSLFRKDLPNDKTFIRFRDFEDSKQLESLDKFKSKAEVIYGDENRVTGDKDLDKINEEYIKHKKKYLSFIDKG